MTDREVMQQALEALEGVVRAHSYESGTPVDAITALRARLAEPEPEPVAWMVYTEGGTSAYVTDNPNDLVGAYRALPLYTAPPDRRPLTDEEIDKATIQERDALLDHIYEYGTAAEGVLERVRKMSRAIERAHGIGGNDE